MDVKLRDRVTNKLVSRVIAECSVFFTDICAPDFHRIESYLRRIFFRVETRHPVNSCCCYWQVILDILAVDKIILTFDVIIKYGESS